MKRSQLLTNFRNEVRQLLIALKPEIMDDYRTHEEATLPGIQVTIGAAIAGNCISWDFQIGDNSYSGAAYFYRHWGIVDLHRRDNTMTLANDVVSQFVDLWSQDGAEIG